MIVLFQARSSISAESGHGKKDSAPDSPALLLGVVVSGAKGIVARP